MGREVEERLSKEFAVASVPARRPINVPPMDAVAELLCPSEDIVLQLYRKEKAQVQRVRSS